MSSLDSPPDDGRDPDEEQELSQHPEAVRARERRQGKRGPGRPKGSKTKRTAPSGADIRTRLREALAELASALEERDPELSRILKRDGPKMAELLGKWGDHPKCPPPVKIAVVAIAEVLEPVRAFGATVRLLLRRFRERRLARFEEEQTAEAGGEDLPWSEPVEPVFAEPEPAATERGTPERFRVQ